MAKLKVKRIRFIVKIPIFNREVLIMLGYSREQAIKKLTECNDPLPFIKYLSKDKGYANAIDRKDGAVLIFMPELPTDAGHKALFEHERRHAVELLLKSCGIKFKMDFSDEVYTYTQQYLAQEIHEELEKYGL